MAKNSVSSATDRCREAEFWPGITSGVARDPRGMRTSPDPTAGYGATAVWDNNSIERVKVHAPAWALRSAATSSTSTNSPR